MKYLLLSLAAGLFLLGCQTVRPEAEVVWTAQTMPFAAARDAGFFAGRYAGKVLLVEWAEFTDVLYYCMDIGNGDPRQLCAEAEFSLRLFRIKSGGAGIDEIIVLPTLRGRLAPPFHGLLRSEPSGDVAVSLRGNQFLIEYNTGGGLVASELVLLQGEGDWHSSFTGGGILPPMPRGADAAIIGR